jgi:hypothetical protein
LFKILFIVITSLVSISATAADTLPKFYGNISISGIETWPNATNPTYGFMVKMTSNLSGPGCGSSGVFSVKSGDFHDQTLSVLLAAMMANKKIRVRVYECSDRPLVDRVEIIN